MPRRFTFHIHETMSTYSFSPLFTTNVHSSSVGAAATKHPCGISVGPHICNTELGLFLFSKEKEGNVDSAKLVCDTIVGLP